MKSPKSGPPEETRVQWVPWVIWKYGKFKDNERAVTFSVTERRMSLPLLTLLLPPWYSSKSGREVYFRQQAPRSWLVAEREGVHEVAGLQKHQHTSSTLGSNPPPGIDTHFYLLVTLSLIHMNLQVGNFPRCECLHFQSKLSQVTSHVWHTLSCACVLYVHACVYYTVQSCIEDSSAVSLFQAQDVQKQA